MVVVLVVSLLISAVGVTVWSVGRVRLMAADRRAEFLQSELVGRAAVRVAGEWLESETRDGLLEPPALDEVNRERRVIDPDRDGDGERWDVADPPWDVRFKEVALVDTELFGAASGQEEQDRFVGTREGPDLLLEEADARSAPYLERMSRVLDPEGRVRVERVAMFGPPWGADESVVASVEVMCSQALPGGVRLRTVVRGEVREVDWGAEDRVMEVAGDVEFLGDARWEWGEAVIGGELSADSGTWHGWPSGIPWAGARWAMRRDNDADGTVDDRDGDGTGDWEAWRGLPDTVPDPWWRGRVGGAWRQVEPSPAGACVAAFEFGPWSDPPQAPVREGERSGLRLACPLSRPVEPIPYDLRRLVRAGVRGTARWVEIPGEAGRFRLEGRGESVGVGDLVPTAGEVVWLELDPDRGGPLELTVDGGQGVLVVAGGDLDLRGGLRRERDLVAPGDPWAVPGERHSAFLAVEPDGPLMDGWVVDDWYAGGSGASASGPRDAGTLAVHFHGLVAVEGGLWLEGPYVHMGAVRAWNLVADGTAGAVRVVSARRASRSEREGPPGAPRVRITAVRVIR